MSVVSSCVELVSMTSKPGLSGSASSPRMSHSFWGQCALLHPSSSPPNKPPGSPLLPLPQQEIDRGVRGVQDEEEEEEQGKETEEEGCVEGGGGGG